MTYAFEVSDEWLGAPGYKVKAYNDAVERHNKTVFVVAGMIGLLIVTIPLAIGIYVVFRRRPFHELSFEKRQRLKGRWEREAADEGYYKPTSTPDSTSAIEEIRTRARMAKGKSTTIDEKQSPSEK